MPFTPEELEELRRYDAMIDAGFAGLTPEEAAAGVALDAVARREIPADEAGKRDRRAEKAAYYQRNRERILARRRAYYREHRDQAREYTRKYRAEHRETVNAWARAYAARKRAERTTEAENGRTDPLPDPDPGV